MSFRELTPRHRRLFDLPRMAVLALLFSVSLSGQSVSEIIIQRERAKLQAEHTGEGFEALYLRTYEGVNQGGQLRTLGPGSTYQTAADPKFVLEEPLTVRVYQSAAVVTGVQAPGGARRVRFVRVWVRDGRDWRIALHQGTAIGEAQRTVTTVASAPAPTSPAPALTAEQAAVLRVQKALSDAYAEHDAITADRWTAPEFVGVTGSGQVIPREQWLKGHIIENQEKRLSSVNDEVKVRIFGDVAVITFRDITPRPDGTSAPPERKMSILARNNGAWRQVLTQSTVMR
jgi:hypothetical protein